jgi:hypothetical protein
MAGRRLNSGLEQHFFNLGLARAVTQLREEAPVNVVRFVVVEAVRRRGCVESLRWMPATPVGMTMLLGTCTLAGCTRQLH